jgi:hypothetical protein
MAELATTRELHPDGCGLTSGATGYDGRPATGWYGYDFLINRTREGNTCSVERYSAESKT